VSLRRRIMDILQRNSLSAHEKIVGIVILLHADKEGVAWPGTATLLRLTSIKRKETVYAATEALEEDGVLVREKRMGTTTRYRFLPMQVIDAVVDAYQERRTSTENRTSTANGTSTENRTGTENRTSTVDAQNQYGLCDRTSTENRTLTIIEQEEQHIRARPMSEFSSEHIDARWTNDDRIEVLNGFKAELLRDFPHVDLDLGLIQVAAETDRRSNLKKAILRKFSMIEQIERSKDRRYQKAAATSAHSKKPVTF